MMFKGRHKASEPGSFQKAYDYALFLLSLRLRSEGELLQKMLSIGYNEQVAQKVAEDLKRQRFLDDQRFAEIFLDNLKKYKNFGFYGIKKKLMEKRLPPELVARVLEEGLPVEEELKIARRFLSRYSPPILGGVRGGKKQTSADKNKTARQLASRGFRSSVISELVLK